MSQISDTVEQRPPLHGVVKMFKDDQGYGFIACQSVERDVFVHYSAIDMPGHKTLSAGDKVCFDVVKVEKGYEARKVMVE